MFDLHGAISASVSSDLKALYKSVLYIVNFFGYIFSLPFSELSLVGLAHRLSVL